MAQLKMYFVELPKNYNTFDSNILTNKVIS